MPKGAIHGEFELAFACSGLKKGALRPCKLDLQDVSVKYAGNWLIPCVTVYELYIPYVYCLPKILEEPYTYT